MKEDDEDLQLDIQLSLSVGITQMPQWPEEKGLKEMNQPEIINNFVPKQQQTQKKEEKKPAEVTGPWCDFYPTRESAELQVLLYYQLCAGSHHHQSTGEMKGQKLDGFISCYCLCSEICDFLTHFAPFQCSMEMRA